MKIYMNICRNPHETAVINITLAPNWTVKLITVIRIEATHTAAMPNRHFFLVRISRHLIGNMTAINRCMAMKMICQNEEIRPIIEILLNMPIMMLASFVLWISFAFTTVNIPSLRTQIPKNKSAIARLKTVSSNTVFAAFFFRSTASSTILDINPKEPKDILQDAATVSKRAILEAYGDVQRSPNTCRRLYSLSLAFLISNRKHTASSRLNRQNQ